MPAASLPASIVPSASASASVELAHIVPNPVHDVPATFVMSNVAYTEVSVDIFDLSGKYLFASGWSSEDVITWNLMNTTGEPVANGVYVCVIRALMDPVTFPPQIARILLFVNR